jgi:hypothetical protein
MLNTRFERPAGENVFGYERISILRELWESRHTFSSSRRATVPIFDDPPKRPLRRLWRAVRGETNRKGCAMGVTDRMSRSQYAYQLRSFPIWGRCLSEILKNRIYTCAVGQISG